MTKVYIYSPAPLKNPKAYLSGILIVLKVDKGKAPGATRLLVIDDVDVSQRTVLGEHLPKIPLRGVQTQAKHAEAVVRIRVGLSRHGDKMNMNNL